MPVLDMPLKELEKYCGSNPRPLDFDTYWDESIAEMKAVDAQIVLERAEFQSSIADCYDMYFTGVNGARIYAQHLRPKNITGQIPAVLQFHGYRRNCGDWYDKLGFVANGMAVFAMDVRGQGGKSEDVGGVCGNTVQGHLIRGLDEKDPKKILYRDIFLDTAQLAGIAMNMEHIDESKVYAMGGSQGGALTLACASLEPRVAKIAPAMPFLCDYKRVWDMDLDLNAYGDLREYFRFYDPRHQREDEIFTKLGYIDVQYLAPRIRADVIMFTGLVDNICPPSTQYAAYNKMQCRKKHVIYPDYGHEYLPEQNDIIYEFFVNEKF